ncbi:AAA family ATPase [Agrobacterium cavarae]
MQAAGHLDDTLMAMRKCFENARSHAPSTLFVDEFDGIGDHTKLFGNEYETYWSQVINFPLELIDGHEKLEGVVVIGATNYPGSTKLCCGRDIWTGTSKFRSPTWTSAGTLRGST